MHFLFQLVIEGVVGHGLGGLPVVGVEDVVGEGEFQDDDTLVEVLGVVETDGEGVDEGLVLEGVGDY